MSPAPDIEDRLRRGLQEAAGQIPPAGPVPPAAAPIVLRPNLVGRSPRTRLLGGLACTAAAVLIVLGAVVLLRDGDAETTVTPATSDSTAGSTPTTTRSARDTHVPVPANGMVAGQAVVVGTELRTFAPDGTQTGSISLAVFDQGISAVSSDLGGGWVACGMITNPEWEPGSDEPDRVERLTWFPRDGAPVELAADAGMLCRADALQVVDSAEGPTVVYRNDGFAVGLGGAFQLGAIVLETGENRPLAVSTGDVLPAEWSAATGRVVTWTEEGGVQLWDIANAELLPTAQIVVDEPADIALSPDATTVAVVESSYGHLMVYDLSTGEIVFDRQIRVTAPGADVSYDGTVAAVSNASLQGPDFVEVFDLVGGTSHAIGGAGLLP